EGSRGLTSIRTKISQAHVGHMASGTLGRQIFFVLCFRLWPPAAIRDIDRVAFRARRCRCQTGGTMARPLCKTTKDGTPYKRPKGIEAAIDIDLGQDLD